MAHIHTEPGQVDLTVNVYVVYKDKVLLRLHEKYHKWLTPGGHVELDEVPEDAAVREVKEETGLDVKIWSGSKKIFHHGFEDHEYRELIPPLYMNIHRINDDHRHIGFAYFALAETDQAVEPDNDEKSGGFLWLTKEELEKHPDVDLATKEYALKALELLAS